MILPLYVEGPNTYETVGVLSRPKTAIGLFFGRFFGKTELVSGYVVNSKTAIEILEKNNQEAADWWKENTMYYADEDQVFIFNEEACEICQKNG